ncbi:MAG: hypothetical protein WCW44_00450 [archaeon]|jgi:hypothetical protein
MNDMSRNFMTILFGLLSIVAPIAGVYVATFAGKTDIAVINSSMIMFLSVLLLVFLLSNAFANFMANHKKMFILGIILLCLGLISFIYHLLLFIAL